MKYVVVFISVLLIVACGSQQPDTDPAINISAEDVTPSGSNAPNLTAGIDIANENVCRTNMQTAAASISMHLAEHSELPRTIDGALSCPDAGAYDYDAAGSSWTLKCPRNPSHGYIADGNASW